MSKKKLSRKFLLIGALSVGSAIFASSAIVAQAVYYYDTNKAYSDTGITNLRLNNWMEDVDGNKRLSELSIPGTHDSAMFSGTGIAWVFGQAWAKTQHLDTETQFKQGMRFFDLRANSDLYLVHGAAYSNLRLEQFFEKAKTFFAQHPSETIVIRMKDENIDVNNTQQNQVIANKLRTMLEKHSSILWRNTLNSSRANPTLNELRGKIFIINHWHHKIFSDQKYGIFVNGRNNLVWQDQYDNPPNEKIRYWELMQNNITDVANNFAEQNANNDSIFINFTSLAHGGSQPWSTAKEVNPRILTLMRDNQNVWHHFGIVPLDYAGDSIVLNIVRQNFYYTNKSLRRGILGEWKTQAPQVNVQDFTNYLTLSQPMKDFTVEVYKNDSLVETKVITSDSLRVDLNNYFTLSDELTFKFYKNTPTNFYFKESRKYNELQSVSTVQRNALIDQKHQRLIDLIDSQLPLYQSNNSMDTLVKRWYEDLKQQAQRYWNVPRNQQINTWYDTTLIDVTNKSNLLNGFQRSYKSFLSNLAAFKTNTEAIFSNLTSEVTTNLFKADSINQLNTLLQQPYNSNAFENLRNYFDAQSNKLEYLNYLSLNTYNFAERFANKVSQLQLDQLQVNYEQPQTQLNNLIESLKELFLNLGKTSVVATIETIKNQITQTVNSLNSIIESLSVLRDEKIAQDKQSQDRLNDYIDSITSVSYKNANTYQLFLDKVNLDITKLQIQITWNNQLYTSKIRTHNNTSELVFEELNAKVVDLEFGQITEINDVRGRLSISFKLAALNKDIVSSKAYTNLLSGFRTELQRINFIMRIFDSNEIELEDKNKLPSEVSKSDLLLMLNDFFAEEQVIVRDDLLDIINLDNTKGTLTYKFKISSNLGVLSRYKIDSTDFSDEIIISGLNKETQDDNSVSENQTNTKDNNDTSSQIGSSNEEASQSKDTSLDQNENESDLPKQDSDPVTSDENDVNNDNNNSSNSNSEDTKNVTNVNAQDSTVDNSDKNENENKQEQPIIITNNTPISSPKDPQLDQNKVDNPKETNNTNSNTDSSQTNNSSNESLEQNPSTQPIVEETKPISNQNDDSQENSTNPLEKVEPAQSNLKYLWLLALLLIIPLVVIIIIYMKRSK